MVTPAVNVGILSPKRRKLKLLKLILTVPSWHYDCHSAVSLWYNLVAMKHLASIYPEDVDSSVTPMDYPTFRTRLAGRAIVFDGDKVALIKVSKYGYYMLPGGGLDDDDIRTGLAREVLEELGAEVKLGPEIGAIEVFFGRWHSKQVDCCFVAYLIHASSQKALTDFELEEGHEVIWAATIAEAIKLVEAATPEYVDGKLVRARDLKFLQNCRFSGNLKV